MRRKTLILILLVFLIWFTGCVDVDVNTKVSTNGSGVQHWRFTTTALLGSEVKKRIESNPLFQKPGVKITDEFKEGDYILTIEVPFQNVKDLESRVHEVRFEKSGFLRRIYTYTETWKRDAEPDEYMMWKGAGSFMPMTLKVSVEMPGKIVESNADSIEENVARWSVPISDLAESKSFQVRAREWNLWVLAPAGLIVVAFVAGMIILIFTVGRRPAAAAQLSCRSCGASIPSGSAFCNSCGSKL